MARSRAAASPSPTAALSEVERLFAEADEHAARAEACSQKAARLREEAEGLEVEAQLLRGLAAGSSLEAQRLVKRELGGGPTSRRGARPKRRSRGRPRREIRRRKILAYLRSNPEADHRAVASMLGDDRPERVRRFLNLMAQDGLVERVGQAKWVAKT